MTIEVYVVGLNEIGASAARIYDALGDDVVVTGFDMDGAVGRAARKAGTVKSISLDMVKPARKADLVFLALPAQDALDTVKRLGPVLKDGAILFDLSPLKGVYIKEALEVFPEGRTYVGAVPAINPELLFSEPLQAGSGSLEYFKNGVMALVIGSRTPEEVVERVLKLAGILGSEPYFVDAFEVDGMTAAVRELPILSTAAYLHSLAAEPCWKEAQRIAGREFSAMKTPAVVDARESSAEILMNKTVVLHRLRNFIANLQSLAVLLEKGSEEDLRTFIEESGELFHKWLSMRQTSGWESRSAVPMELPDRSMIASLFGIRPRRKK